MDPVVSEGYVSTRGQDAVAILSSLPRVSSVTMLSTASFPRAWWRTAMVLGASAIGRNADIRGSVDPRARVSSCLSSRRWNEANASGMRNYLCLAAPDPSGSWSASLSGSTDSGTLRSFSRRTPLNAKRSPPPYSPTAADSFRSRSVRRGSTSARPRCRRPRQDTMIVICHRLRRPDALVWRIGVDQLVFLEE